MTDAELEKLVRKNLDRPGDRWSDDFGAVLYSNLASIRPGPFYLIGINPGGHETEPGYAITRMLHAADGMNEYADVCWKCSSAVNCRHLQGGKLRADYRQPIQHRVCDLINALGIQPSDILSTNLIFCRSSELAKLKRSKAEWKRRCWGVHRELLRQVRPKWIITLGWGEASLGIPKRWPIPKPNPITNGDHEVGRHCRIGLDLGGQEMFDVNVLSVVHPGNRRFALAGLGNSHQYPPALKRFINQNLP